MADVVKNGLCIGCGACELVCSYNAIVMVFKQKQGVYHPYINESQCTQCGSCLEVCFGASPDFDMCGNAAELFGRTLGTRIAAYIGHATDEEIRFNSSSGGVATALIGFLLKEKYIDGAIVVEMRPGNPPQARPFIASNQVELRRAMGSKYCPLVISKALQQLEEDREYVFVGLPCQIYAVKKLVTLRKLKGRIKLFIGLVCGGTPILNGTRYLLRRYGFKGRYLKKLRYRGDGWPGHLVAETDSLALDIPFEVYWPIISPWFHFDRCMVCLSGQNVQADISLADAWLEEIVERDGNGTSVLVARNRVGERILKWAQENGAIAIESISDDMFLRSQECQLDFKQSRFYSRVKILSLFRKNHLYNHLASHKHPIGRWGTYLDELLLVAGRYLAADESRWGIFDVYRKATRVLCSFFSTMRRLLLRSKQHSRRNGAL